MVKHNINIRICYADTDQMGFVYYGNYAKFFEIGRVELIRSLGTSYKQLENMGLLLPVAELKIKYLKPAKYDDLITIETTILECPTDYKIRFNHKIFNEENFLLVKGEVLLYTLSKTNMKTDKLPESLLNKLK